MQAHQTEPDANTDTPVEFRRLYGLARPHLRPLLAATVLLMVMSAVGLAVPMLAGQVIDSALEDGSTSRLRSIVGGLIGVFALLAGVAYVELVLLGGAGARLLHDLRSQLFDRLLGLSPAFYDSRRIGELLSRLGSDLSVVQMAITEQIPQGLQALLRFVGTLIVLLVLEPELTLVALLVVPPVIVVAVFVGTRLERLSKKERDSTADSSAHAEETLAGIRTIQAMASEDRERTRYGGFLSALLDVQLRNVRVQAGFTAVLTFAGFSSFALVLGYGGQLMIDGELRAGELAAFLLYTLSVAMSVGQLGGLYAGYRKLKGSSARLFELLDTVSAVHDPARDVPPPAPLTIEGGALQIEDVSFRYESAEVDALANVSIDVEPGRMVAFVGPSGSGKSTLFSLILRFYDPTNGSIRIEGRDVRTAGLGDLRRNIGLVSQDVTLFSGSVTHNLRLAAPDATDDEIAAALEAAAAKEFVDALPKGVETEVGERGVRLSGGEQQRLTIARAFLADPKILLLDEPTSALDSESEALVQEALQRLFPGRTTLVIAHRLSTARRADEILVLEKGQITGRGTHDALMESSARYRRLWELQSEAQ